MCNMDNDMNPLTRDLENARDTYITDRNDLLACIAATDKDIENGMNMQSSITGGTWVTQAAQKLAISAQRYNDVRTAHARVRNMS